MRACRRKPTRRDLLVVVSRLQTLIGRAHACAGNDQDKNRLANTQGVLNEAFELCLAARSQDPPADEDGPWAGEGDPVKSYV